jgi:FMN phosphatase YigB (HAD superfamily)
MSMYFINVYVYACIDVDIDISHIYIHINIHIYIGAIDMLEQLNKLKKTVVIVSNTSGRSKYAAKKLNDLGFLSSRFDGGVVSIYIYVYIYIYI